MLSKTPNTALLLFTRTVAEEVRTKRLILTGSCGLQYQVATTLVQQSQQVLAATNLPFFVFSSDKQKGNTFAERLHHAFSSVFALGFESVIVIGNDCPQLKSDDILAAVNHLSKQEVILGPDKSGGVYLLGLTRRVFEAYPSFSGIRWNTSTVLSDAIGFFKAQAIPFVLPTKYQDLNTSRDFQIACRQKLFHPAVFKVIKRLLGVIIPIRPQINISFFTRALIRPLLFRGPPALFQLF